jgi:hypothetical protein
LITEFIVSGSSILTFESSDALSKIGIGGSSSSEAGIAGATLECEVATSG